MNRGRQSAATGRVAPSPASPYEHASPQRICRDACRRLENERDAAKREALLRKIYAEDITMYDAQLALTGIKPISDFIGQLQAGDATFHYGATKPIEIVQDGARLFGAIQTAQGPLASMDFILFEDGKAAHLYAFIGPAS